jgi:putative oxidoreductase
VPVLVGATWAHASNGWLFTAPKGGWEYPAFLALVAVVVGTLGGGRYSLLGQPDDHGSMSRLQRA